MDVRIIICLALYVLGIRADETTVDSVTSSTLEIKTNPSNEISKVDDEKPAQTSATSSEYSVTENIKDSESPNTAASETESSAKETESETTNTDSTTQTSGISVAEEPKDQTTNLALSPETSSVTEHSEPTESQSTSEVAATSSEPKSESSTSVTSDSDLSVSSETSQSTTSQSTESSQTSMAQTTESSETSMAQNPEISTSPDSVQESSDSATTQDSKVPDNAGSTASNDVKTTESSILVSSTMSQDSESMVTTSSTITETSVQTTSTQNSDSAEPQQSGSEQRLTPVKPPDFMNANQPQDPLTSSKKGSETTDNKLDSFENNTDCLEYCALTDETPVCGTDGNVYQNECQLKMKTCGKNIEVASWENCRGKHILCPKECLNIQDPVCGEDGRVYPNLCLMYKFNCGKIMKTYRLTRCYNFREYRRVDNACPKICPELYRPVCSSSGKVYSNECYFRIENCGKSDVQIMDISQCVTTPKCPYNCAPIPDQVCGSDGVVYLNHCYFSNLNCGKKTKLMPISFCEQRRQQIEDNSGSSSFRSFF